MAEGGGLLNRYTFEKMYRGFESLRLRQIKDLDRVSVFQITPEIAYINSPWCTGGAIAGKKTQQRNPEGGK